MATGNPLASHIPDDVLKMIFEAGIFAYPGFNSYETSGENPFALVVSQVSRSWRWAALNDPLIWTIFTIKSSQPQGLHILYSERSKPFDVDIHLVIDQDSVNYLEPALHSDRCRQLVISLSSFDKCYLILKSIAAVNMPHLKSYEIDLTIATETLPDITSPSVPFYDDSNHPFLLFGTGSPLLSFVKLRDFIPGPFLPLLNNVTTLHLETSGRIIMSDLAVLTVLKKVAGTLTHLILHGEIPYFDHPWDGDIDEVIEFPRLLHLDLRTDHTKESPVWYIPTIFSHLRTPILESLSMTHLNEFPRNHSITLESMTKAQPRLISLHLFDANVKLNAAALMAIFPNIKHLTLEGNSAEQVLEIMAKNGDSYGSSRAAPLWPHLETLAVDAMDRSDPLLQSALISRHKAGLPLKKMYIAESADVSWANEYVTLQRLTGEIAPAAIDDFSPRSWRRPSSEMTLQNLRSGKMMMG